MQAQIGNLPNVNISNPFQQFGTFQGMNNNNFIEILFKHILDKGVGGLSLLFILQLYLYLSLDKIQDLSKYLNDKIAEFGKARLESFFSVLQNFGSTYIEGSFIKGYTFLASNIYRLYNSKMLMSSPPITAISSPTNLHPQIKSDNMNRFVLNLFMKNRVDIMSICSYIFQHRDKLQINDLCTRSESTQRHTNEIYNLPSELEIGERDIGNTIDGSNVGVRFVQNINLQVQVESNHSDQETVREVTQGTEKIQTNISLKDLKEFETFLAGKLPSLSTEPPLLGFPSLEINGWQSSPHSFTNNQLVKFWILVFLSKNPKLLDSAVRFVCGEPFKFEGRTYVIATPFWEGLVSGKASNNCINSTAGIKELQNKLDSGYRDELIAYISSCVPGSVSTATNSGTTNSYIKELTNVALNLAGLHQIEPESNNDIYLEFRSETMTNCELDNYARTWMWTRIQSYYHDSQKREGDKISIYKMGIQYSKEVIEVNNPAFQDWLDANGITEEEFDKMQEEKKKKADDEKDKADKKDKASKTKEDKDNGDKDKDKGNQGQDDDKKKEDKKDDFPVHGWNPGPGGYHQGGPGPGPGYGGFYPPYGGTAYNYYNHGVPPGMPPGGTMINGKYVPPAPPKLVKKDKLIPKIYVQLVKKDRKPLDYLYLPEDKMATLQKYLKNFKNFRERFEKYGVPYRGGILLSGVPGCGKSSTILATATFLMKDIYYLDLGQIKNNDELKLCVEYLRINSKTGGIVIFEDIDCSTPIVLRRTPEITGLNTTANANHAGHSAHAGHAGHQAKVESTNLQVKKTLATYSDDDQQPLSLSFLLNVLDGTMAPDDVIFIMTTNFKHRLDPALIRPGRIDLSINVTHCTRYQLSRIYKDLYDNNIPEEILERFPENKWITAKVILHLFHNSFNRNLSVDKLMESFLLPPKVPASVSALTDVAKSPAAAATAAEVIAAIAASDTASLTKEKSD